MNGLSRQRLKACIITPQNNLSMMIKELAKSTQLEITATCEDSNEALELIRHNKADFVIIDDNSDSPSVNILRKLYTDPIASLTPYLTFLLEHHANERILIKKLGSNTVLDKPLTPTKFYDAIKEVRQKLTTPAGKILSKIRYEILTNNHETAVKMLHKVHTVPELKHLIVPAYANYFSKLNKPISAEKILLEGLGSTNNNAGIIISLGELYFNYSQPKLANRILEKAKFSYGSSHAILFDLAQSYILLKNHDKAIAIIKTLIKDDFNVNECKVIMAKLLFSDGKIETVETELANNKSIKNKLYKAWERYVSRKTPTQIAS